MTAFAIVAPPRILFGRGQAGRAVEIIREFGSRVFLVHGKGASRANWLSRVLAKDAETLSCWTCGGEPSLEDVATATAAARKCGAISWPHSVAARRLILPRR